MPWFTKKSPASSSNASPVPKAVKGLKIAPLLSEQVILFPGADMDKTRILEDLVAAVCRKAGRTDSAAFLAKTMEREQGISTTLDTGLSLPHARMDGIDGIMAGMAVLKSPLVDPKQADLTIRVIFMFFSPNKQDSFPLHLQLLRGVSSLFQPSLIDQLTAAPGPAEALALVRKIEG